ncbi:receptor-interacting serine/threonine-protein kinase 4-like protein [Carex littledalei]|uniref:Receptor-interacting serine/threonine-protein kinase 4-like protein n=1 Tax=Carex littledalei TaxID=544730 RepID=A0A833VKW6_9POAL|nr:receptor-interacting serine/threonine-protein kinase 4-like protein [Carex littledalei]
METTTNTIEELLEVIEQEVSIDFKLNAKCRSDLHLRSLHPSLPIFFKIQTSSPEKFHVNPPSGSLPPLSAITLQVILRPQTLPPSTFPRSSTDRFLIRSALSPADLDRPIVISSFPSIRLRVSYVGPYLLRLATSSGDSASARLILDRQPYLLPLLDPSNENDNHLLEQSWLPIHASAAAGDYNKLVQLIEMDEMGKGLQARDRDGRTALHVAVSRGHVRCVKALVGRGAEKDVRSHDGRTVLHLAAANGDAEMVALLVEMGADPTVLTDRGMMPVDAARDKGYQDVVDILKRWELVMAATRQGDLRRLESLLKKRAAIQGRDQYGTTALHLASIKGQCDIMAVLIKHGIHINCKDLEGHTPLHLAVEGGCLEAVELLVGLGADVNAQTKRGATPLEIAVYINYDEIARFLRSRGAVASSSLGLVASPLPPHLLV